MFQGQYPHKPCPYPSESLISPGQCQFLNDFFVPGIYAHILCYFPLTGCPFTKPDVIFKLEQEEEPWVVEEEVLRRHCPG